MDELSEQDKLTVERARKIQRFMSQPFAVAQVFTGIEGRLVPLKEVRTFCSPLDERLTLRRLSRRSRRFSRVSTTTCPRTLSTVSLKHDQRSCPLISSVVGGIEDVKAKHEKSVKEHGS